MKQGKVNAAYERLRSDFGRLERWIVDSSDEHAAVIRDAFTAIELGYVTDRAGSGDALSNYGGLFDASRVRCDLWGDLQSQRLPGCEDTHSVTIVHEAISSLSYASVYDYLGEVRSECIAMGLMLGRFSRKVTRLKGRAVWPAAGFVDRQLS